MGTVITARGLSKSYGPVKALDAIDFAVEEGEIFGLIGADGAGKTTTFRILGGVLEPSGGEAQVLGARPRESRAQVGYLTQPFSLYLDLSVMENLRYAAGLREVSTTDFDERSRRYLELFDLQPFTGRLAGRLSGGMKQKLALCCALIGGPRILLLDEPTTGVDPVSRRDFWDTLATLSAHGITIVVATPYLDEAERCHRVALMERGRIYQVDEPAVFRSKLGLTRLEWHSSELVRAESILASASQVADVQRFGDRLDVLVADPDTAEPALRRLLTEQGVPIEHARRSQPTLENAFVATLRSMRGQEERRPFPGRSASLAVDSGAAIGAYGIEKHFGDFQAVKDFNLEIRYGEIYGLLGANGAGKTTAIKMLCGLLSPTAGSVALLGRRKKLRSAEVRSRIGYMSQKFTLYDDLTIGQNLDFYTRLYGIPERLRQERKQWVLQSSGLAGEEGTLTGSLPGGWKQRVAFGAAVMHEPAVVFLDEPTSGVDPLARRAMWRLINEMADRGAAVLVVTHYLEEAEQCNRLGFMVAGEIIAQGSPGEVKRNMQGTLLELETADPQAAMQVLRERFGGSRVSLFGDRIHLV
ncbi:MAG TPA: ATP-binding cassette domain-containing protein, partial [Bryobacteraceae bacterium]|nr:ATP-binding cassette domain-containing protein [Bryobacteraceae bacterium]